MATSQARLAFAGAAVAAALSLRPIAHRCVFPGADGTFPPEDSMRLRARDARVVRYAAPDGTALAAAWLPSARGEATVVYFHMTSQSAGDSVLFAEDLAARGVSVLLPEHRGYGGLAGRPSREGLLADANAAIAQARALAPGTRIVLVGRSLGAAVAAEMAARGEGDALVLASPFTTTAAVARGFGAFVPGEDRFDVVASLARVRAPVTIVHGTRDGLVPFAMGAALAGAHPGARLIPLDGAGHNDLFLVPNEARFLDAIVAASAPSGS